MSGAAAAVALVSLLSPNTPVTPPPPLATGNQPLSSTTEVRFPLGGHVTSRQLVAVGLGPDGAPVRVTVTQRLRVEGTGDYEFTIPAPATSVVPGPGSQSVPGLRDVGIVWQGFSNRSRVLSATASLRPRPASAALPLRVLIERRAGSTAVRLQDVASRRLAVITLRTTRKDLLTVLGKLRAWYRVPRPLNDPGPGFYVHGRAGKQLPVEVVAPLRVTGTISAGGRDIPVDEVLGAKRPEHVLSLPGVQTPKLALRVGLLPPIEILPTRPQLARSADPLNTLQTALGAIATSSPYKRFLTVPDPAAPSAEGSYVYRTVAPRAAAAARAHHGGGDALAILLGAALGALAIAGLVTLWARS